VTTTDIILLIEAIATCVAAIAQIAMALRRGP
jgi:hypothetical protein